jgi:hypothetical protein
MSVSAAIEAKEQSIASRQPADAVDARCQVRDRFANPTAVERRLAIRA